MPGRPTIPFGEWRPDTALLDGQYATIAENVFPAPGSYVPMPALGALTTASLSDGGNNSTTKVMLHFEGADASTTITDDNAGGSAHTWTVAGDAQIDTAQFKFGVSSLLCDGTGDWITTNDHADFALGSSNFRIAGWARPNTSGALLYIAGQGNNALSAATTSFYISRTAANKIEAAVSNGSAFTTITGTSTNFTSGSWKHFEFGRSGTTLYLFLDGNLEGTATAVTVNDSSNALRVGAGGEVTTTPWNGWIDDFQMDVGLASHTASFTAPTVSPWRGGTCVGLTIGRTASGSFVVFAGTATRLFKWNGLGWVDISRLTGGNYNVASGDRWSFQQSGTKMVAVNINDAPQVYDIDSGSNFAALGGSPPQATHVAQIGDFLVLSGLSTNRRKIQWSAINDITGWTVGTNLSDEQEFPESGPVVGVAGGEIGIVLQDTGVRLMQFLPGDTTTIFSFSRVERERGGMAKYGFIYTNGRLYFQAEDGFYSYGSGGLTAIGAHRVNEWFIANCDPARRHQSIAFSAPNEQLVLWAYYSSASAVTFDRLIVFDWFLDRWTYGLPAAQMWAGLTSTGVTLDADAGGAGDTLLDSTAPSLDSYIYVGGRPVIGAIDPNGLLSFLNGNNLAVTVETGDMHLSPGMRSFVSGAYPMVDAPGVTVAAGTKENPQDATVWDAAYAVEDTGWAPVYSSSRVHRFRAMIPADTIWTQAQGVQIEAQQDGEG